VLRQGFRRGDRVLRTAMVAVTDPESPAPVAPEPEAAPDDQPTAG
jgi:molecular chaperone GrpE